VRSGLSGPIDDLALLDDNNDVTGGLVPVVPFVNENGEAQFEPFRDHIDGIRKQILDRMTIATIQAFKQRAFKGLPKQDDDGNDIDYEGMFIAAPGAVWDLPRGRGVGIRPGRHDRHPRRDPGRREGPLRAVGHAGLPGKPGRRERVG
jgi:hypothetical protein